MTDTGPERPDGGRAVRRLERAMPWIMLAMFLAIVLLLLLAVVLGAPWAA